MKNWKTCLLAFLIFCGLFGVTDANPAGRLVGEVMERAMKETLDQAFKVSGKAMVPAMREAAERALRECTLRYGDEVLDVVRLGGLEMLEQGAKHGDDFWKMCLHSPNAARAFALHADELMPLARRIGPEVAEFEAKHPGIVLKTASEFGDDGIRVLNKAPSKDVSKMLSLAENADSPATREMLLKYYQKSPNKAKFLENINWKTVVAVGLSTAMVLSAYEVSAGVRDSIEIHGPELLREGNRMLKWSVGLLAALLAFPILFPLTRKLGSLLSGNSRSAA
ncbi:MAG: hypothetical protein J6A23_13495 [Thermoguttaceae bacterium]|nr:hypothetical protein [Thermoguttaceae bacterium]MBP3694930.1 hypothetical protein [Thermoguttaceae bacterium]